MNVFSFWHKIAVSRSLLAYLSDYTFGVRFFNLVCKAKRWHSITYITGNRISVMLTF